MSLHSTEGGYGNLPYVQAQFYGEGSVSGTSTIHQDIESAIFKGQSFTIYIDKDGVSIRGVIPEKADIDTDQLIKKYLEVVFLKCLKKEELQNRLSIFKGISLYGKSELCIVPVSNPLNDKSVINIVVIVNGKIIDLEKLPNPPIVVEGNTINGLPLDDFAFKFEDYKKPESGLTLNFDQISLLNYRKKEWNEK